MASDNLENSSISFDDEALVNLGVVFHEHSTTLISLVRALNPVIEALDPNPFGHTGEPSIEEVETMLEEPVLTIISLLKKFIIFYDDNLPDSINFKDWNEILNIDSNLEKKIEPPLRPAFVRHLMRKMINLFSDTTLKDLKSKECKNLILQARRIEKVVCLYDLNQAKSRILMMEQQAETLRDFLTFKVREKEEYRSLNVRNLIHQVMQHLHELSNQKRIDLKLTTQDLNPLNTQVLGRERDLRRALTNILHNSIKYSWKLYGDDFAWVNIRCFKTTTMINIEFENWGVPILSDEIKSGAIFKLGYRGTFALDNGRLGNGIGLYDALNTAHQHKGTITVKSEPANKVDARPIRERPYITKVTFSIPFYK